MSHTTLGLGDVRPPQRPVETKGPCPRCGAPANKRLQDGGFGPTPKKTICGVCAYEFPGVATDA